MKINKLISLFAAIWIIFSISAPALASGEFPIVISMGNGIKADIYLPETIMEHMTCRSADGNLILSVPDMGTYLLVERIDDPAIANKGDGSFHPVDAGLLVEALSGVDMGVGSMNIEIDIFVLPLPRRFCLSSSTKGTTIFISPGVCEVDRETASWTVTHEFGHCMHNRFLPDEDETRWSEYLILREVPEAASCALTADHGSSPHEIFAEDFRYLFGCEESRYSGTIENPGLALPDQVEGLAEFFVSLVSIEIAVSSSDTPQSPCLLSVANYPNPFNPATTIITSWDNPSERDVEVSIYDIRGSLVRKLFRGPVAGNELSAVWDGRGDGGRNMPSGVYFYRVKAAGEVASGKMLLVR